MRIINATVVAVLAATAGLIITADTAGATAPATRRVTAGAADARQGGFFERYRGHHIMGWGRDESACAYIDGVQLVLYPLGDDRYLSALQAYKEERGVRAITKASVRVLGSARPVPPADPVPHCPELVTDRHAGS
jgi:hypothetical protein